MIIGSFFPLTVGTTISGIYVRNHGEEYMTKFLILAPATHTDWQEYRIESGLDTEFEGAERGYFYRVSTD